MDLDMNEAVPITTTTHHDLLPPELIEMASQEEKASSRIPVL